MAVLKPSAEYNRRAVIIEGLCFGHSATEIIQFFGIEIIRLWRCGKIYGFRTIGTKIIPARKSHSKERTARTSAFVERTQALISDPEQISNKSQHLNVTLLKIYWGNIRRQRYIIACVRTSDREWRSSFKGDLLNNCGLQESFNCHVKGFFVIFNFSLKTFYLKKLFNLSGLWWPVCDSFN